MTDFQFRVWVYLITYVDDYGRGSADPELIKGIVFPRRDRLTKSDIGKALADLEGMGCIRLYSVDGESYFCFPNWSGHQRIQTKRSKFPAPDDGGPRNSTVSHGELPSESKPNRNQSESKFESESETKDEPRVRAGLVGVVVEAVGKLSQKSLAELDGFVQDMGENCVLKALEIAQEAGRPTWPYVRGVLRNKRDQGITCAEDWDRAESRPKGAKGGVKASVPGVNYQPSAERARKNADWLEEFLAEQEGKP